MRQFRDVVSDNPVDLLSATLHVARLTAYPDLNVQLYQERIEQITALASEAGIIKGDGLSDAERLSRYLREHLGYRGNMREYADPRNSYLCDVIDRKVGIPITLSILYMAVAARLGLEAYGVGMPGHFVVLVVSGDGRAYFDCFNGVRLSEDDCVRLVRETTGYGGTFQREWLEPTESADILIRVLNNLRIGHMQNERWDEALICLELIDVVKPGLDFVLRDKALIAFGRNQFYKSATLLDQYATAYPNAPDIPALKQSLSEKMKRWANQN